MMVQAYMARHVGTTFNMAVVIYMYPTAFNPDWNTEVSLPSGPYIPGGQAVDVVVKRVFTIRTSNGRGDGRSGIVSRWSQQA